MKNKVRKNPRKDLLVSLVLLVAFQVQFSGKPLAEDSEKETLKIAGLTDSVEIILDQWGIPHIYANSQSDLFFAQGFNAARDRLFQFELWRRRALGMLAEIQGEKALEHDISARLFKFRGNIDQELAYYHNDSDEIIRSFVSGVNAYIRLSRKHPEQLPIEFRLLGIEPGFWTPEVVVSRHNALTGSGAGQEHMIAKLITSIGDEKTKQLLSFSHEPSLHTKGGINLADINDEVLKTYRAYRSS